VVGLLVALALAAPAPPRAYLETGSAKLPLTVVSWCWRTHCGAPFTGSTKTAVLHRGSLARVRFAFAPTSVHVTVGGRPTTVATSGTAISWRPTHAGGVTIQAFGSGGWVTYVTRLRLAP
jgi:hypothetical protein